MLEKNEISIKVALSIEEYKDLKEVSCCLDITKKKVVNKSIKYAWKDFNDKLCIRRSEYISVCDYLKQYTFKIKEKQYVHLEKMSKKTNINKKELLRTILSYYVRVVQENEGYQD